MQNAVHVVGEISSYMQAEGIDIALMQELYNQRGKFNFPIRYELLAGAGEGENAMAAIVINKDIEAIKLQQFCD